MRSVFLRYLSVCHLSSSSYAKLRAHSFLLRLLHGRDPADVKQSSLDHHSSVVPDPYSTISMYCSHILAPRSQITLRPSLIPLLRVAFSSLERAIVQHRA